ncbi:MAG: acetate--CoA ligase family protein [Candidatus Altiarchaeota archaeon]|nr:acetate--CoA ligase family protein [Candidatus Altiarchaeota archaeon]
MGIFDIRSVAVIGAPRETYKVGHKVFSNIIRDFKGKIYPINPKAEDVEGFKCYPSILDVPDEIDLAVIVIPAKFVPKVVEECGQKKVKTVVIISAGFKETGVDGAHLERQCIDTASKYGMRIIGPNCIGFIDTYNSLNATFAPGMPKQGKISFMSQSGALCTSILDWARMEDVGFSKFVSLGNKADLSENEFLELFEEDENTTVILAYLEGLKNGVEFVKKATKVSRKKPIIVLKSGRTESGAKAVASHTGTLAGSDQAYTSALIQSGVIRAETMEELFDYALAFSNQPVPKGGNVAIVTNAGGPGIIATDACEKAGLKLACLSFDTIEKLKNSLPPEANMYNPIDVLGDATEERFSKVLDIILQDDGVDSVIVVLTPQAVTDPAKIGETIASKKTDKPILCSFIGGEMMLDGFKVLKRNNIPNYLFPERAVTSLKGMTEYKNITQRDADIRPRTFEADKEKAAKVIEDFKKQGKASIGLESLEILEAYGIPVTPYKIARSINAITDFGRDYGYPLVLKIVSQDILHKTDIGGVKLNVTEENVRSAYNQILFSVMKFMPDARIQGILVQRMVTDGKDIIVGMNKDPQLGPLVMFGLGGIYVELLKDVSFRIAPVSEAEARRMITETKGYQLLRGIRGEKPSDIKAVEEVVQRVSQLVSDFPEIVELDVNQVKVFNESEGIQCVDARIILDKKSLSK